MQKANKWEGSLSLLHQWICLIPELNVSFSSCWDFYLRWTEGVAGLIMGLITKTLAKYSSVFTVIGSHTFSEAAAFCTFSLSCSIWNMTKHLNVPVETVWVSIYVLPVLKCEHTSNECIENVFSLFQSAHVSLCPAVVYSMCGREQ